MKNSRKQGESRIVYLLSGLTLTVLTVAACWFFAGRYGVFGANMDWISQHSVFPEYFRQQFYETGQFFPEFAANIGGGQNIYNFSYYGLYGDDEDSWKSQFEASGAFDKIDTQIAGLGEIAAIQDLYVAHTKAAMDGNDAAVSEESEETSGALEDGTYEAEFDTDSGMFHVNEANDGKGILTVKDGKMTIHISLVSKNIVNLYVGKAADAQKDGAELLQPTTDTITYDDGSTEEVYGFDVPVKALDETFDLALVGTKGKWYDHEVSVSNPVKAE